MVWVPLTFSPVGSDADVALIPTATRTDCYACNPQVMAGQGTVSVEILEQLKEEEASSRDSDSKGQELVVYTPVGGGGLIGGMSAVRAVD